MQSRLGLSLVEEFAVSSVRMKQINYQKTVQASKIPSFLRNSPEAIQGISRFASTVSRDLVYNVGKFFGVKFKPWGAVKTSQKSKVKHSKVITPWLKPGAQDARNYYTSHFVPRYKYFFLFHK